MDWKKIKIGLAVFSFASGLVVSPVDAKEAALDPYVPLIILVLTPLMTLLVFGLQFRFNHKVKLTRPRLDASPLDFHRPSNFLHTGGLLLVSSGVGAVAAVTFRGTAVLVLAASYLAFGLGILAGLGLILWVLKDRVEPESRSAHTPPSGTALGKRAKIALAILSVIFLMIAASSQTKAFEVGKGFVQSNGDLGPRANMLMAPIGFSWGSDQVRFSYLGYGSKGFSKGSLNLRQTNGTWNVETAFGRNATGETVVVRPSL